MPPTQNERDLSFAHPRTNTEQKRGRPRALRPAKCTRGQIAAAVAAGRTMAGMPAGSSALTLTAKKLYRVCGWRRVHWWGV